MSKKTKIIIISVVAIFFIIGIIGVIMEDDSKVVDPNASSTGITKFTFEDASSVNLELSDKDYYRYNSTPDYIKSYVSVEYDEGAQISDENIVFASDDESVAIIEFVNSFGDRYNFKISAKGAGTTTVYVKTSDNKVVSSKITVNVVDNRTDKEDEAETTTTTTTTAADVSTTTTTIHTSATTTTKTTTTKTTTTTTKKPGRTVYITPTGEKYHYDKECAGPSATARDFNDVKNSYGPCGTCVQ